jgi:hypothetical protein
LGQGAGALILILILIFLLILILILHLHRFLYSHPAFWGRRRGSRCRCTMKKRMMIKKRIRRRIVRSI